jgi:protein O-GlcNAc transferase
MLASALLWLIWPAGVFEDGIRLSQEGRWAEARAKFALAVSAEPRNALAWKALGVAAGKAGDPSEAEEALGKACRLQPNLEDACYYHARALYTLNRFEAAIAALRHVLTLDPRQGRAFVAIGQAYEALGRESDAEKAFHEALQRDDAADEARLRYGKFLYRSGRMPDAIRVLSEAVAKRESFGEALAELGRVYYQTGRLGEAIPLLERARALRPDLDWVPVVLERARRRN